jgi:phosphatidylglycerol lysyltransferase
MRLGKFTVLLISLVTFGSGLVTLQSLIGPGVPERLAALERVFPLEVLHYSRFVTLVVGFALVATSFNIYKRKKRAYRLVVVLSCVAIVAHIVKGLDYEEAIFTAVYLIVLWSNRRLFTVRSSAPTLAWGLLRISVAIVVALSYGTLGLWVVDRIGFKIDLPIGKALHETLLIFSLVGRPSIVPHTRYARWFIDSMYLMTITSMVYSLHALFRPVIYQLRVVPRERALASEILSRHGRSSIDFFKVWPDKSFFFSKSRRSFLSYRVGANFAVALGDPVGPEDELETTIGEFVGFCAKNDWIVAFHHALADFMPIYRRHGFRKLKLGDEAIVDLTRFSLEGRRVRSLRSSTNKLEKMGIHCEYHEPPIPDSVLDELEIVSDDWLKLSGHRERRFTLGRFKKEYLRTTPVLTAVDGNGRILGFLNVIPSYRKGESTIDLMRRRREAPNGIMDYLFVRIFVHDKEKGFERFSLGLAPMSGFQADEVAGVEEKAIHYFFQHLGFIFNYRGLKEYKAKFADNWEPIYVYYKNPLDLPRLALAISEVSEIGADERDDEGVAWGGEE